MSEAAAIQSRELMKTPNYSIENINDERILIRDLGPWNEYPTITNNAEAVVAELVVAHGEDLGERELHYIDSEGDIDRLLVEKGSFAGFKYLPPEQGGKHDQRKRFG